MRPDLTKFGHFGKILRLLQFVGALLVLAKTFSLFAIGQIVIIVSGK